MSGGAAVASAATFFWLGAVVAISFIEAPLKFRAPGVTLQIGLGIGRLVFRAINTMEVVLAAVMAVGLTTARSELSATTAAAAVVAIAALGCQLVFVRPRLTRRADLVLGETGGTTQLRSRSRAHHGYIGLELVKIGALVVAGVALLAG